MASVVASKQRTLQNSATLVALLDDRYSLFACDLHDADSLLQQLCSAAGFDSTRPTLVLCECTLSDLSLADGDRLLSRLRGELPQIVVVAFDYCTPDDVFGTVLRESLTKRVACAALFVL